MSAIVADYMPVWLRGKEQMGRERRSARDTKFSQEINRFFFKKRIDLKQPISTIQTMWGRRIRGLKWIVLVTQQSVCNFLEFSIKHLGGDTHTHTHDETLITRRQPSSHVLWSIAVQVLKCFGCNRPIMVLTRSLKGETPLPWQS